MYKNRSASLATPHFQKGGAVTSDLDRRRRFIVNAAFYAVIVGIVFLVFRYLLNLIWPFFIAFLFAWIQAPFIRWLMTKCHVKHKLSVAISLLLFFALLGGIAVLIASRVVTFISDFIVWLPHLYGDTIQPGLNNLTVIMEDLAGRVSPGVQDMVNSAMPNIVSSIGSAVTSASMRLVSALSGWATKLPSRLLSALICVIATVFLTADFPRIISFLLRQIPEKPRHIIAEAKETLKTVVRKYGRSYGIIMGITFLEILAGLVILRQRNAVLLALMIAIFDIFPIVGAGMILGPWGIFTMLGGSVGKGAGLLLIYVVEIIVRQFIEPRIVGRQVGLHPLVTLIAMFVGSKLFGGVGLLGLPITCAIVTSLDQAGVIHIIRRENSGRADTDSIEGNAS